MATPSVVLSEAKDLAVGRSSTTALVIIASATVIAFTTTARSFAPVP